MNPTGNASGPRIFQQFFNPGLYEIHYQFLAPSFDPKSMYFDWQGRTTGPWDYAPSGPNNGDCLLPCVHLRTSDGTDTQARVFIPRQEELDAHLFNGRVGFYVQKPQDITIELSSPLAVQWQDIKTHEVKTFADHSLRADDFQTQRLFFLTDDKIALLKQNWGKSLWCQQLDDILDDCDGIAAPSTLDQARNIARQLPTQKVYDDNVIFWGNYLVALSLRTLILDKPEDLDQLIKWIDALVALPIWGSSDDPKGRDHNNDLTADFNMLGLVLALNWHQDRLGDQRVQRIRKKIRYQGQQMFHWITTARSTWPGVSTQNHAYFGHQTILLAGAALLHVTDKPDPEALHWLQIAASAFKRFADHLPSDGSYHEGIGYINFGLIGLIPALMLFEQFTGQSWLPHDWFKAHFPAMNDLLPIHHGHGFDVDDGDRCLPFNTPLTIWAWCQAPDATTREAAGQLLAKAIAHQSDHQLNNPRWIAGKYWCLLLSPQLTELASNLPAIKPCQWQSHYLPAAGYCLFKLGTHQRAFFLTAPPHGHELFKRESHTYAYGHHHPDTGNILLIDDGKWILSDSGYTYCKASSEHNILLVDGKGQHNDNYVWMPPPPWDIKPTHVTRSQQADLCTAEIDMAYIYPKSLGLESWVRTVHAGSDCMLIIDQMQSSKPAQFTLTWGSDDPWVKQNDTTFMHPAGWRLTALGDPCQITQQRLTPARRFIDHSRDWHALRLGNEQPVTQYRLISIFEKSPTSTPNARLDQWGIAY